MRVRSLAALAKRRAVAEYLTGKTVGAESTVDPSMGRCADPTPLNGIN